MDYSCNSISPCITTALHISCTPSLLLLYPSPPKFYTLIPLLPSPPYPMLSNEAEGSTKKSFIGLMFSGYVLWPYFWSKNGPLTLPLSVTPPIKYPGPSPYTRFCNSLPYPFSHHSTLTSTCCLFSFLVHTTVHCTVLKRIQTIFPSATHNKRLGTINVGWKDLHADQPANIRMACYFLLCKTL